MAEIRELVVSSNIDGLERVYQECLARNKPFRLDSKTISLASKLMKTDVLEWWLIKCRINDHTFINTDYAIDLLIVNFNDEHILPLTVLEIIKMLDWWLWAHKMYQVDFCYAEALNCAGKIQILDWFWNAHQDHGIPFIYDNPVIYQYKNMEIVEWWLKRYAYDGIDYSKHNSTRVLINYAGCDDVESIRTYVELHSKYNLELKINSDFYEHIYCNRIDEIMDILMHNNIKPNVNNIIQNMIDGRGNWNCRDNIKNTLKWWMDYCVRENLCHLLQKKITRPASDAGAIDVLTLIDDHIGVTQYDKYSVLLAMNHKDINVLEWWLSMAEKYGFQIIIDKDIVGSINYEIEIVRYLITKAKQNNYLVINVDHNIFKSVPNVEILCVWTDYFRENGLEIKYHVSRSWDSTDALSFMLNEHLENGIPFIYGAGVIEIVSMWNHINVLDWWLQAHLKYGIDFHYNERSIDLTRHAEVLLWWYRAHRDHGIQLKYTSAAIDQYAYYDIDKLGLLETWYTLHQNGIEMRYTSKLFENHRIHDLILLFKWFVDHQLPIKHSTELFVLMIKNDNVEALDWMLTAHEQGVQQFQVDKGEVIRVCCTNFDDPKNNLKRDALEWWHANGHRFD